MTTSYSIHFGLNNYASVTAAGTFKNLRGCENDARLWRQFAFEYLNVPETNQLLRVGQVDITKGRVLDDIRSAIARLQPKDKLLLTYSGHGVQCPSYDLVTREPDGVDECLVTSDFTWENPLRDNELGEALSSLPQGSLCLFIVDSCHSGSITRAAITDEDDLLLARSVIPPEEIIEDILIAEARSPNIANPGNSSFSMQQLPVGLGVFSACQSNQLARETYFEGQFRGAFSVAIRKALSICAHLTSNQDILRLSRSNMLSLGAVQQPQLETGPSGEHNSYWSI